MIPVVVGSSPIGHPKSPCHAFDASIADALRRIRASAPRAAGHGSIEHLHRLRVAMTRLRAALRVFRPVLRRRDARPIRRELKRIAPLLGGARDWDVFCVWLAGADAAAALLRAAHRRRLAARLAARAAIGSKAFRRLLGRTERIQLRADFDATRSLHSLAGNALGRLLSRARRAAKNIDWQDPAARHALRIKVKRLRYACEFFAAGYPRRAQIHVARLKQLQQLLGDSNDISVARRKLRELTGDGAAQSLHAALDRREVMLLRQARLSWKRFARYVPFWIRQPRAAGHARE